VTTAKWPWPPSQYFLSDSRAASCIATSLACRSSRLASAFGPGRFGRDFVDVRDQGFGRIGFNLVHASPPEQLETPTDAVTVPLGVCAVAGVSGVDEFRTAQGVDKGPASVYSRSPAAYSFGPCLTNRMHCPWFLKPN
jgi:hypothetical protein